MTEPLTPTSCDLRDFPWMPLDCTRLLTSETWLLGTAEQKVAALTLWVKSWHQMPAGSLPDNEKMLAILSEAGPAWKRVREHALRGWVRCDDGRLYHPVVCEKALESHKIKQAQKARTEAARAAKAQKYSHATTPVTEPVTEIVTASTRPDQTGQDQTLKERKKEPSANFPCSPSPANTERAETEPEPSWPPKPLPSAVTTRVEQVALRLADRSGARGPKRSVAEQLATLAVVAPKRVRSHFAAPEQLAEARARLTGREAGK
jgi:hypothetical protein